MAINRTMWSYSSVTSGTGQEAPDRPAKQFDFLEGPSDTFEMHVCFVSEAHSIATVTCCIPTERRVISAEIWKGNALTNSKTLLLDRAVKASISTAAQSTALAILFIYLFFEGTGCLKYHMLWELASPPWAGMGRCHMHARGYFSMYSLGRRLGELHSKLQTSEMVPWMKPDFADSHFRLEAQTRWWHLEIE